MAEKEEGRIKFCRYCDGVIDWGTKVCPHCKKSLEVLEFDEMDFVTDSFAPPKVDGLREKPKLPPDMERRRQAALARKAARQPPPPPPPEEEPGAGEVEEAPLEEIPPAPILRPVEPGAPPEKPAATKPAGLPPGTQPPRLKPVGPPPGKKPPVVKPAAPPGPEQPPRLKPVAPPPGKKPPVVKPAAPPGPKKPPRLEPVAPAEGPRTRERQGEPVTGPVEEEPPMVAPIAEDAPTELSMKALRLEDLPDGVVPIIEDCPVCGRDIHEAGGRGGTCTSCEATSCVVCLMRANSIRVTKSANRNLKLWAGYLKKTRTRQIRCPACGKRGVNPP